MNVPVKIQMNMERFSEYLHKVIRNVENPDPKLSADPSVIFTATVKLFRCFELMWASNRRINVPPPEDDANLIKFVTTPDDVVLVDIRRDELASILRYIGGPYLESFTTALKEKATTKEVDKSMGRLLCDHAIEFFSSALKDNASCYYFPNSALSSDEVETESGSSAPYPSDSDATSAGYGFGSAVEVEEDEFEEEVEDEKESVLKDEQNLAEIKVELKSAEVKVELKSVEEEPVKVKKEEPVEVKKEPKDLVKAATRKRHASESPTSSSGSGSSGSG